MSALSVLQPDVKHLLTIEQAWAYKIVPEKLSQEGLHLFIDDKQSLSSVQSELEIVLGKTVVLTPLAFEEIEKSLNVNYPKAYQNVNEVSAVQLSIKDGNFLESLVKEAQSLRSSDIHIEVYDDKCRIRFRVDGQLIERHKVNKAEYPTLINKIKISAKCDIAEKRLPQDGRIRYTVSNSKIDIRVSILPTLHGEKVVLRLLGNDASHIDILKLGFTDDELERYKTAIQKTHGIILISGPTGSGKTTTLYATLKQLNKPKSNILTIEDPIEYTLDGVNQVQLNDDIGLTYSEALRTFLRQDPDVIMLGEIRDAATAQMAIRAALTGHLVLSTIHTNSAWGTISRLIDMGVPAYLLANTINLSVAQRLVRILCPHCKKEEAFDAMELPKAFRTAKISRQFKPVGCNQCYFTGYKGRKAVYEVINITRELSEAIKEQKATINEYCKLNKISTLAANVLDLFEQGNTSLEEIYPYLIHED
jgi:general secretion pathway protein E/type IV pilus assembly protein PilB